MNKKVSVPWRGDRIIKKEIGGTIMAKFPSPDGVLSKWKGEKIIKNQPSPGGDN